MTASQTQVARVAKAMLSGRVHYLEGAQQLVSLRCEVGAYENDPDYLPFVVILSEIRQLPIDTSYAGWASAIPTSAVEEVDASVAWAKRISLVQCQSLMERYT